MISFINRIVWLLSILTGLTIVAIDTDFWLIGLLVFICIRMLLSKNTIVSMLATYESKLKEKIIQELRWSPASPPFPETPLASAETLSEEIPPELLEDLEKVADWDISEIYDEEEKILTPAYTEENIPPKPVDPAGYDYAGDPEYTPPPGKIEQFFRDFFATNLLAKIGGIVLALGVIFLMGLIYTKVGDLQKILIGFAVGFAVYICGYILEKKWLISESMILMGTGILVNYIVILGGRFFIGDDGGFLGVGTTFLFLVANTLFSFGTGWVYSSRNVLLFSLVSAFGVPFFVQEQPIVIHSLYTVFLGLTGIILAYFFKNHSKEHKILALQTLGISLVGGNILILLGNMRADNELFMVQMIAFLLVNVWSWIVAYKSDFQKYLLHLLSTSFVFLLLVMLWVMMKASLAIVWSLSGVVLVLLGAVVYFLWKKDTVLPQILLFVPLAFVLVLVAIGGIGKFFLLFPAFSLVYILLFVYVRRFFTSVWQTLFFGIVGFFLTAGIVSFRLSPLVLDMQIFATMNGVALVFLLSTYFFSKEKSLHFLYPLGTLLSILMLLPIWQTVGIFAYYSIMSIGVLGIFSWGYVYVVPKILENNPQHFILGNILWAVLLGIATVLYGNIYLDNTATALVYILLAVAYMGNAFFAHAQEKTLPKFLGTYTFSGIALAFTTAAIAVGFAHTPIVVSILILAQAGVLLGLNRKLKQEKLVFAALVLSFLALVRYWWVSDGLSSRSDMLMLGLSGVVGLLSCVEIFLLKDIKSMNAHGIRLIHIVIAILFFRDLDSMTALLSRETLVVAFGIVAVLYMLYIFLKDHFLKRATHILFSFLLIAHMFSVEGGDVYSTDYIGTVIVAVWLLFSFLLKDEYKKTLSILFGIYLFVITSQYLYAALSDYFTLTIYWWVLALLAIYSGLFTKNSALRGIGLYLIILTLSKITLYDVWNGIDNPILRVVALIFVGAMLIYISTLYTRKKLSMKEDLLFYEKKWTPVVES